MSWRGYKLFLFIFSASLSYANSANALEICSMTFNSSAEKEVLKKRFPEPMNHFHELVPENKDPNWLATACQSRLKCDLLLISGHFGGVFFGEKSSQTLDLSTLEELGCSNACPGIMNAKRVFLMGCNTLATKRPDQRSIPEYIRVLVGDGFTEGMAETVASSRYVNVGLSLEERMSLAFSGSNTLYGFTSVGPVGAEAAPRLKRALKGGEDSWTRELLQEFSGTSISAVEPGKTLPGSIRSTLCEMHSPEKSTRIKGDLSAFHSSELSPFFDAILGQTGDPALLTALRQEPHAIASLRTFMDGLGNDGLNLPGVFVKRDRLKEFLGLLSHESRLSNLFGLLQEKIERGLDYLSLQMACDIARQEPELSFPDQGWEYFNEDTGPFLVHLAGCFRKQSPETLERLKRLVRLTGSPFVRREALRALHGRWRTDEVPFLTEKAKAWNQQDRAELDESLMTDFNQDTIPEWKACESGVRGLLRPTDRDNSRWSCFQRLQTAFPNLTSCLIATADFETPSGLGARWTCLKQFPAALALSACKRASDQTADPEKADDFLFSCWDALRVKKAVNRSECLGFTGGMRIFGNRIKQNWNCMNQISK